MYIFKKLTRLLTVSVVVYLTFTFLTIYPAYARNIASGFTTDTVIATPNGDVPVEKLQPGDRVLGYNFETHHSAENTVEEIRQKSSISYYLINDRTKIVGTNLIYVSTLVKPKLIRPQQLKTLDKIFTLKHNSTSVNCVEQIVKPINIYQVILDNSKGNLYADSLLIHVGDEIPAYFKRQFVDCQPGTPYFKQCPNINSASGLLAAIVTVLCVPLVGTLIVNTIIYVRNSIHFGDRS